MAFGISRIFRSTDAGAPFWNASAGSFNSFLKSILVNGYGSTQSLGWTLEYELGNTCVFRMKGGTRRFIQVVDSVFNDIGTTSARVASFSTMSSVNLGTDRMPPVGINSHFSKTYDTWGYNGSNPWICIGDDAGIWILSRNLSANVSTIYRPLFSPYYIGDYIPIDIRNKWNFTHFLCNAAQVAYPISSIYLASASTSIGTGHGTYIQRNSSFGKGCVACYTRNLVNNTNIFGENYRVINSHVPPDLNGVFFGVPIRLFDNLNVCVGSLPGVLEPIMYSGGVGTAYLESEIAAIEKVDSAGNISIFAFIYALSNINYNSTAKLIFKVGKGFRDAQ